MSRVQSTDFDLLACVWVRTVRLTSRLDVKTVSVPSLDMCESISRFCDSTVPVLCLCV